MSDQRIVKPYFETLEQIHDISSSLSMPVKVGPASVVSYKLSDQSGSSSTSPASKLSFQRNFSPNLLINRCMILEATYQYKYRHTYTSDGQYTFSLNGSDANAVPIAIKDAYPLQSTLSSLSVSVNSSPLNYESAVYNHAFAKMIDEDDKCEHQDSTCVKSNTLAVYQSNDPAYAGHEGTFSDRLKGNGRINIQVATAQAGANTNKGSPVNVTLTITVREPIMHPYLLLSSAKGMQSAFSQLHSLAIDMNVDATRCPFYIGNSFSADAGGAAGAQDQVPAPSAGSGLYNGSVYILAYQAPTGYSVPRRSCIPMLLPSFAPQSCPTADIPAGGVGVVNTPVRNISRVPEYFVVYMKKNGHGPQDLEASLPIEQVYLNFDNKSNLLADFTQWQLYDMSKRNGCKLSWDEFNGTTNMRPDIGAANVGKAPVLTCGSYLVIPVSEVATQLGTSPGVVGSKDVSIQLTVRNRTTANIPANSLTCILATLDNGVFVTEEGSSRLTMDLLSQGDVIKALEAYKEGGEGRFDATYVGGSSWLSSLGKGLKSALPVLKGIGKVALKTAGQQAMATGNPGAGMAMSALGDMLGKGTMIGNGYLPKQKDHRFK